MPPFASRPDLRLQLDREVDEFSEICVHVLNGTCAFSSVQYLGPMPSPPNLCIRLRAADRDVLTAAAEQVDLKVTTYIRRAALAVARRSLTPAAVNVGGEVLVLTESLEEAT